MSTLSILQQIEQSPLRSIPELLRHILTSNIPDYQTSTHAIKTSNGTRLILDTLLLHACRSTVTKWAIDVAWDAFKQEIIRASNVETGLHFNTSMACSADLIGFDLQQISLKLEEAAPFTWSIIQTLLDANSHAWHHRQKGPKQVTDYENWYKDVLGIVHEHSNNSQAGRDELEGGGVLNEMEAREAEAENTALLQIVRARASTPERSVVLTLIT